MAQRWEHSAPTNVGSNPRVDAMCGLSLLLVLSLATKIFLPVLRFSLSSKTKKPGITLKSLFIYLSTYLLRG